MACWSFRDYVNERGDNLIHAWLQTLSQKAKAKINVRIQYLEAVPVFDPQYVSALSGYPDLLELRVVFSGVQYRPIACYGPAQREVTLLFGATERGDRFDPPTACDIALRRRSEILADRRRTVEHDLS